MSIRDILNASRIAYDDVKNLRAPYAYKDIVYRIKTRERRVSFGNLNQDKTFYIIRSIDDKSPYYIGPIHHLLANYFYVLSHLLYIEGKGYIPIVDQKNYPVYNKLDGCENGTDNPWEYFWEQPCDYTLDEVYNSKNIILSKQGWKENWNLRYSIEKHQDPILIDSLNRAMQKVPLKRDIKEYIDKRQRECFPNSGKIIGVTYRFAGYSLDCPMPASGHPIQLSPSALVELTERKYEEWNADYVFLTSDEENTVDLFKSKFGKQLICVDRMRRRATDPAVSGTLPEMYQSRNILDTSKDYLLEMEMLSNCNMLIGSITTGLRYAIVKNNGKYEKKLLLDNGLIEDSRIKPRRRTR